MNPIFFSITTFASTYNCGTYGAGTYNDGTGNCYTSTDGGTGSGGSGGTGGGGWLADTGVGVVAPLASGAILITLAIALLISTLKRRKK